MGDEHGVWPLILTPDDVVFQPVSTGAVLDSAMEYRITNAPDIVAYSEMEHAAEHAALTCERPGSIERSGWARRWCWCGARSSRSRSSGLRPVRTVAWWRRAWEALGDDLPFPPFRPDPLWDELVADAARISVTPSEQPDHADEPVDVAAFRRLEPGLTVVGLDDEFVSRGVRGCRSARSGSPRRCSTGSTGHAPTSPCTPVGAAASTSSCARAPPRRCSSSAGRTGSPTDQAKDRHIGLPSPAVTPTPSGVAAADSVVVPAAR